MPKFSNKSRKLSSTFKNNKLHVSGNTSIRKGMKINKRLNESNWNRDMINMIKESHKAKLSRKDLLTQAIAKNLPTVNKTKLMKSKTARDILAPTLAIDAMGRAGSRIANSINNGPFSEVQQDDDQTKQAKSRMSGSSDAALNWVVD